MPIFIISLIVFFSSQLTHCQEDNWKLVYKEICEITEDQWQLITWYLQRVQHIEVTQIVIRQKKHKRVTIFANYLVKHLFKYTQKSIKTYSVDFKFEEVAFKKAATFEWHTNRFESRDDATRIPSSHDNSPYIEDDVLSIQSRSVNYTRTRDDEPAYGSIIIAQDIYIINNYLNGQQRHPFKRQRAHYIIIVYKHVNLTTWDKFGSTVMTKLWKDYGILNGIILSTCKPDAIGYYDPYVNLEALNLPDVDKWGVYRSVAMNLLDFKDDWILRKDSFLNGFPLIASMFLRFPTAIPRKKVPPVFLATHYARAIKYSKNLAGFDGLVLGNLAERLRFDLNMIMPQDSYGSQLPNNTFTGTLGDVYYGRAEGNFNLRFMLYYNTTEIEFLFPVFNDKVCIIAPAAERIPQWTAIFKCFDIYVWILLLSVTFICGCFWFVLKSWAFHRKDNKVHKKSNRFIQIHDISDFQIAITDIWKVMLGASTSMPMRSMERFFIGACLLANLIIIGTFQGSLYTSFTTISYYKNIDTLDELAKSKLPIGVASPSLRNLFGDMDIATPKLQSLNRKFIVVEDNPINRAAKNRDICSVERYSDVNIIIKTNYQRDDGSTQLHVVTECPRHYFLGYIVREGWPLLPRFNSILSRFAEAGLLNLWYQQMERAFLVYTLIHHNSDLKNTKKKQPFSFMDIQTAFYILALGQLASCLVFIVEVYFWRPKKSKHTKRKSVDKNKLNVIIKGDCQRQKRNEIF